MQKTTPKPRKAALAFIFVMVVLDVMALGIIIPVLPKLVESMSGGNTARAAEIYGIFGTAWGLMQFVFSPILGALSDRYGRRPILLFSTLGLGLDYILMAVAPDLVWLFIGRIVSGIAAANFSTANAYIADVTPPEDRAGAFGLIGAAFGIGFVLGPALGGIMGDLDPRLPFWVAAGLTLANAAYGFFVLPELLPVERRMAFSWARANPIGSLRLLARHRELLGLAGVAFLYHLAHVVLPAVAVLYTSYRYGWDGKTMGLTLAAVGVASGDRAGWPHTACHRLAGRAHDPHRRPALRHGRVCHLWSGDDQRGFLGRHSGHGPVGPGRCRFDGHHEPPGERLRARAVAGGQFRPDGIGGSYRPSYLQHRLCALHRRRRDMAATGRPLPAGVGDAARGHCAGLVGNTTCERVTGDIGLFAVRRL